MVFGGKYHFELHSSLVSFFQYTNSNSSLGSSLVESTGCWLIIAFNKGRILMDLNVCRLFYSWATRLFVRARRKNKVGEELEEEDLFDLTYFDETDHLLKNFDRRWQRYLVR